MGLDLGLAELTDDQLLDLLEQSCLELAKRDGYVRQLAQSTIVRSAHRMLALREAVQPIAERVRRDYLDDLKRQVTDGLEADMREALRSGDMRLNLSEETAAVVEAVRDCQAKFYRSETRPPTQRAAAAKRAQQAAERYARMQAAGEEYRRKMEADKLERSRR